MIYPKNFKKSCMVNTKKNAFTYTQENFAWTAVAIMSEAIEKTAKKLMEIMEGCKALADTLAGDDEEKQMNAIALVELMHHFTFEIAPFKAQQMVNKKQYPY